MDDNFGGTESILLAQETKLQQYADENTVLGAAVEALKEKLKAADGRASSCQRRAAESEAKLLAQQRAKAATAAGGGDGGGDSQLKAEVESLKRKSSNDRILLEQAERHRRDAEQQLAASRQGSNQEVAAARQQAAQLEAENRDLQQRLAAAQRQVRQLESLQSFADSWDEQQRHEQKLAAALSQATGRLRVLEGRCTSLEGELQQAASALQAAQQLAAGRGQQQPQQEQQQGQQQGEGSLSLSDLCDLEGCGSPQRSTHTTGDSGGGGAAAMLPSRQRALQQRHADRGRQAQQEQQQRQEQQREAAQAEQQAQASVVASLQQQLLEQQRQLALLQLQQHVQGGAGEQGHDQQQQQQPGRQPDGEGQQLLQLEKLKRRNTQLQTALADTCLQHARGAAAAQRQLAEAQQEVADTRQKWEATQQQLAQLQATAAALAAIDGCCEGGVGGSSERLEQLHEEMLEYAGRCNAAVEQNAVLLQEKKQWLEKLQAAEADVERCRAEVQQLRLQHLQLPPSCATSSEAGGGSGRASQGRGSGEQQRQEEQQRALLQRLLEAQAGEAALRSVLSEAREVQVAACKALSGELRRVHALERLRISDVREVQRVQRRLHDLQRDCQQLSKLLVAAQQQLAAASPPAARRGQQDRACVTQQQQEQQPRQQGGGRSWHGAAVASGM